MLAKAGRRGASNPGYEVVMSNLGLKLVMVKGSHTVLTWCEQRSKNRVSN